MNTFPQRFDTIAANYVTSEIHAASPTLARLNELAIHESVCDLACGAAHS